MVHESVDERVNAVVRTIPAGYVMTYGDVAGRLGLKSARQVGSVLARGNGAIPWHRVLRANGSMAEGLIAEQSSRLRSEGVEVIRERVDLKRYRW